MTELEIMQRAKMYMDKLSQGIDPITGQTLAGDSSLNNPRLGRCFAYVSGVLQQVIANDGYVGSKPRQQLKPFVITAQQLAQVQLSSEPVRISQLAEQITAAAGDPGMRKMNTTVITNWLLEKGFLEKKGTPEGKSIRIPTPAGQQLGLYSEIRQGLYGPYETVYYNLNAQRFVLDHLFEMLAQP